MISAGESSGDQRAAALLRELRRLLPGIEAFGMGGAELAGAGCRLVVDSSHLDVMGFADVLRRLPEFRGIMGRLVAAAERERPDAALVCDYPGFNLRLAARLKARGIPVICYVSPQVWAWNPGRVRKIARLVDRMLVLFPFEVDFYRRAGSAAEFVGHPLADELPGHHRAGREQLRAELAVPSGGELLALLPGSRPMELARHLRPFAAAAALVRAARPEVRPAVAVTPAADAGRVREMAAAAAGFEIPVLPGRARDLLAASDLAIAVSGTATLEAALLGCPTVVCYRTGLLNYLLGRLLLTVPCIALANVVAGRPLLPELWQWEVTPGRVADAALAMLEDVSARSRLGTALSALRDRLGVHGASRRAAEAVRAEMERHV
jgi:lipid-A-disaccharide synthase